MKATENCISVPDPRPEGGGGTCPTLFAPNSFKNSINWPEYAKKHEFFSSCRAHKVKLLKYNATKFNKSTILNFFSAIIELVRELVTSSMHENCALRLAV